MCGLITIIVNTSAVASFLAHGIQHLITCQTVNNHLYIRPNLSADPKRLKDIISIGLERVEEIRSLKRSQVMIAWENRGKLSTTINKAARRGLKEKE